MSTRFSYQKHPQTGHPILTHFVLNSAEHFSITFTRNEKDKWICLIEKKRRTEIVWISDDRNVSIDDLMDDVTDAIDRLHLAVDPNFVYETRIKLMST